MPSSPSLKCVIPFSTSARAGHGLTILRTSVEIRTEPAFYVSKPSSKNSAAQLKACTECGPRLDEAIEKRRTLLADSISDPNSSQSMVYRAQSGRSRTMKRSLRQVQFVLVVFSLREFAGTAAARGGKALIAEQKKRAEFEKDATEAKAGIDSRFEEAQKNVMENFQIWKDYVFNPRPPQT